MNTSKKAAHSAAFTFPYLTCRNISAPEDEAAGRKVYAGHAPASSVLELEDDDNVREYLVDAQGKLKRMPTLVHQAIRHAPGHLEGEVHQRQLQISGHGDAIVGLVESAGPP